MALLTSPLPTPDCRRCQRVLCLAHWQAVQAVEAVLQTSARDWAQAMPPAGMATALALVSLSLPELVATDPSLPSRLATAIGSLNQAS